MPDHEKEKGDDRRTTERSPAYRLALTAVEAFGHGRFAGYGSDENQEAPADKPRRLSA